MTPKAIRRIIAAGMLTVSMTQAAGETQDSHGIIRVDQPDRWPRMGPPISGADSNFLHELAATKPEFIKLFMGH